MKITWTEIVFMIVGCILLTSACFAAFSISDDFTYPVSSLIKVCSLVVAGFGLMLSSVVSTWWRNDRVKSITTENMNTEKHHLKDVVKQDN